MEYKDLINLTKLSIGTLYEFEHGPTPTVYSWPPNLEELTLFSVNIELKSKFPYSLKTLDIKGSLYKFPKNLNHIFGLATKPFNLKLNGWLNFGTYYHGHGVERTILFPTSIQTVSIDWFIYSPETIKSHLEENGYELISSINKILYFVKKLIVNKKDVIFCKKIHCDGCCQQTIYY